MRYVLIGPPGVGKSTVVHALHGCDLEDVPQSERMRTLKNTRYQYYGAADTAHLPYPEGCQKILLWLPSQEYDSRRATRDAKNPMKKNQRQQTVDECFKYADFVVDASGLVEDVVFRIKNAIYTAPRLN